MDQILSFLQEKTGLILTGLLGSMLSVVVTRDMSWWAVIASVGSGIFLATVATEPTIYFWGLPDIYSHGVAGFYGIVGRNLLAWITRLSKNPEAILGMLKKK